ncbi:MAG: metal-dependent transcriptional regulator [Actinomycetaceae bacterium]|nr:metal-dependent transcriptional regulator [Actinomycetaceae bacterium]
MSELIDSTEMYLKTVFEMVEDGVPPLRARIVDRLGHSGPTVSQTVARMERDGLVEVQSDRQISLSERGSEIATEVMRKHRLAECLLLNVIGLSWEDLHDEACRWEHVMSDNVEKALVKLLGDPFSDPYGNPIPGTSCPLRLEKSLVAFIEEVQGKGLEQPFSARISRVGEPIQAEGGLLAQLREAAILPSVTIEAWVVDGDFHVVACLGKSDINGGQCGGEHLNRQAVVLSRDLAQHFFVQDL